MAENNKDNTKLFRPAYNAEFNMGGLDYNRMDEYLKIVDNCMVRIRMGDFSKLHLWFSWLRQIYSYLKAVTYEGKKAELDSNFNELEKEIWKINQQSGKRLTDLNFIKKLETLNDDVYNLRQLVGMGIPVKRNFTNDERLKKALEN